MWLNQRGYVDASAKQIAKQPKQHPHAIPKIIKIVNTQTRVFNEPHSSPFDKATYFQLIFIIPKGISK